MRRRKMSSRTSLPFHGKQPSHAIESPTSNAKFDVKIGINPISWTNDDLPWLGGDTPLEVALSEGKAIGYQGFELGNKFPREPAALRAVLARHRLELVSGWYSGELARRSLQDEVAAVASHLKLLADNGAKVMVYGEVADSIQGRRCRCTSARASPATSSGKRMPSDSRRSRGTRSGTACGWRITTTWAPTSRRLPMSTV